MKRNQGVSLIEILVSCVIMALLIGGLSSLFVSGSRWMMDIRAQNTSQKLGKLFLDPMQMYVRGSDWDNPATNALTAGVTYCNDIVGDTQNPLCPTDDLGVINDTRRGIGKIIYNAEYNISAAPDNALVRKVRAVIYWNELEAL